MIRVKVPATSANLCIGFDAIGISLSLYNEFEFESSITDDVSSFDERFQKNNLVLESYRYYFKRNNINYIPVKIKMVTENIPTSRGLGSSATCIVAGLMAARYFAKDFECCENVEKLAIELEGHPDNVIPAIMGGLVCSFKNDEYEFVKYNPSDELIYYALIPDFELETRVSRRVLPESYNREDVINNISRICNLPYAFINGDISLIKKLFVDKIHEPYRYELINNALKVKEYFEKDEVALAISGAGPTLLAISKKELSLEELHGFKIIKLNVDKKGVTVYEV